MTGTDGDTIFALASGPGPSAIAVVRISGPAARGALAALSVRLPPPRRAALASLMDTASGEPIDRALILWFPGPASATGEDVVELHLHGGRAVVADILAALARVQGCRHAVAGEFTRRALLNGRMDLAEVEGLADLLAAETSRQRRHAQLMAGGHVSQQVEQWRAALVDIYAQVEAQIDFGDEDEVAQQSGGLLALELAVRDLQGVMAEWLARPAAEAVRDGLRVVVAGPPNAGKSTLINALANREVSIVSPLAGTTRDIVEVALALDGIVMRFADTAGLRAQAGDAVEAMGIARAEAAVSQADMLLWLGDVGKAPDHPRRIVIAAQADRLARTTGWSARAAAADIALSAVTGEGMADLHRRLVTMSASCLPPEGLAALNQRQRAALAEAEAALRGFDSSGQGELALLSDHLRVALAALDRLTGRAGIDDMLDALFSRFCLGK